MIETLKLIFTFLNENIGIITLIVGLVAIYLYKKQQKDHKRDAARLILQEIRYAERQIRKYKEFKRYALPDKLLPTNSWNGSVHLFVKDLKETDIDLINGFYAKAAYIDVMIMKISDWKTQPKIPISPTPPAQLQPSVTAQPQEPTANAGVVYFDPMQETQNILREVSVSVEFIYNTPTVEKLRKISEKRWYQLI